MRIVFVGNFDPMSVGEPEEAAALEALGHTVVRLPERETTPEDLVESDMLLFSKFRIKATPNEREAIIRSRFSVAWLHDLYFNL